MSAIAVSALRLATMSFLTSPIAGALLAGGVYYGLSNLMQTRTEQLRRDLHALSVRMVETPTMVQAPPPAATRVKPHPISAEIKAQWNKEIEALYRGFQNLDTEWGKRLFSWPSEVTKGREAS